MFLGAGKLKHQHSAAWKKHFSVWPPLWYRIVFQVSTHFYTGVSPLDGGGVKAKQKHKPRPPGAHREQQFGAEPVIKPNAPLVASSQLFNSLFPCARVLLGSVLLPKVQGAERHGTELNFAGRLQTNGAARRVWRKVAAELRRGRLQSYIRENINPEWALGSGFSHRLCA